MSSSPPTSALPPSALAAAALADPAVHRQCEQDFIQHVQALLDDDRLRIDTVRGRRPVAKQPRTVARPTTPWTSSGSWPRCVGPTATCSTACRSGRRST